MELVYVFVRAAKWEAALAALWSVGAQTGSRAVAQRSTSGCIKLPGDRRFLHIRSLVGISTGVSADSRHGL